MSFAVQRHKTAIKRSELSRPLQLGLEHGLVTERTSVFDYGCGRGDDIRCLHEKGVTAEGWDPLYHPEAIRTSADVVNLGYVVNVIEDPRERVRVLQEAWALTQTLLIVSARLSIEANRPYRTTPYSDGHLTSRGTFQKYYDQLELKDEFPIRLRSTLGISSKRKLVVYKEHFGLFRKLRAQNSGRRSALKDHRIFWSISRYLGLVRVLAFLNYPEISSWIFDLFSEIIVRLATWQTICCFLPAAVTL